MAGQLVPVFTPEELTRLEHACAGRSFAQRRDTAIMAVLRATGIRLAELAGLRYNPGDPQHSDIDLRQREIAVRGKGGKPGSSRSATRQPAASTGTCAPDPGTGRPGGPSCGWASTTGSR